MTALVTAPPLPPLPCAGGCGQYLTDPVSRRVGYGPDCADRHGIPHPRNTHLPRPASTVQGGPSLLDHLNGDRMDDTLFPEPALADPDEEVAREEITAYYDEHVTKAQAALDAAQAELDKAAAERDAWTTSGELPGDLLSFEAAWIAGRTMDIYQKAAWASINKRGDLQLRLAAETARGRDEALRRWLTARGHELGALALPAPDTKKR